jgi:hypothetical protein
MTSHKVLSFTLCTKSNCSVAQHLQIWSVVTLTASANLGRAAELILEVEVSIGQILLHPAGERS